MQAFGSGCGPSPADADFMKMVSQTREKYTASQIRDAVLPLFTTNAANSVITSNGVPRQITDLPLFSGEGTHIAIWTVGDLHGERRGLAFVTGSGFGHWGIVVCPFADAQETARTLHGRVVPWENGVFFFKEW
jgi:hypothetical protein